MKEALLVIDMLNDFVGDGAPLEVPKARKILPILAGRLARARSLGVPVLFLCNGHEPDDREFARWPPHALRGTAGAQIVADLAPLAGETVVEKATYSAFHGSGLDEALRKLGAEELILTGCVTNICILYTAADAVMRGYRVRVPADSVADLDEEDGAFALRQMEQVLGVVVER